ncbi:hypothetical protein Mp_2g19360 [Marchantia polymorpha subsp. ruderalis]|uniref:Uncharacterized protein n=1 Tax=Marchantia polymorpha TaxID=3197 RepID=A0A2R6WVI5_MARPO|nr:hypothetical protein MARPO_0055s0116 [Marchantia polymorpha]BBN02925.1 hypothetical protein Mp_2g19360 [Marchantia polymorpha subsp. ruderalis]|eukprot:PTQ37867.1 hypothetical protein MARPO_0055s0116 [Marchantia polymorpha]
MLPSQRSIQSRVFFKIFHQDRHGRTQHNRIYSKIHNMQGLRTSPHEQAKHQTTLSSLYSNNCSRGEHNAMGRAAASARGLRVFGAGPCARAPTVAASASVLHGRNRRPPRGPGTGDGPALAPRSPHFESGCCCWCQDAECADLK